MVGTSSNYLHVYFWRCQKNKRFILHKKNRLKQTPVTVIALACFILVVCSVVFFYTPPLSSAFHCWHGSSAAEPPVSSCCWGLIHRLPEGLPSVPKRFCALSIAAEMAEARRWGGGGRWVKQGRSGAGWKVYEVSEFHPAFSRFSFRFMTSWWCNLPRTCGQIKS